jgi:DNA-binding transcriptional LysR family regulator
MRGTEFAELTAFAAVAEQRSFARAAAQLAIAPSTLSQTIRGLEERLGVRLLNRTTRSVALTEPGERLLAQLRPALEGVSRAIETVNEFRDKPIGTLRIVMGRAVATTAFAPMIAPFLKAYPEIALEAVSEDARVDLASGRFDAGLRIGELIERDMIAIKLVDGIRLVCVAAPSYLEGRELPRTPRDLAHHECIRHRWKIDETIRPWQFEKDGERIEIDPQGRLIVNEAQNIVTAAVNGVGIAYIPARMAAPFVVDKRLVLLLADWCTSFSGLYLYYPSRRQIPPPLQAFIDFARKALSRPSEEILAFDRVEGVPRRASPR